MFCPNCGVDLEEFECEDESATPAETDTSVFWVVGWVILVLVLIFCISRCTLLHGVREFPQVERISV